jgi:hypothetical protein
MSQANDTPLTASQIIGALAKMGTDEGYFSYGNIVWDALEGGQREQMKQLLFQGPVWDGCVVSKAARDDLIRYGLATRCCFMGEDGYTAATYLALSVFKQGGGEPLQRKRGIDDRGKSA